MQERSQAQDRENWLAILESGLQVEPDLLPLLLEYAIALEAVGKYQLAEATYRRVYTRDPDDFSALNNLARLVFNKGQRVDAFMFYRELVGRHPQNAKAHANLAYMLLLGDDPKTARLHYERALKIEPDNVEAHRGLAIALERLDESALAAQHHAVGFDQNPLTILPYRGEGTGVRTLMIVSSTPGNIHFEHLLDDQTFAVTKILAESERHVAVLPEHDLLINAVGDADAAMPALRAAENIVARSNALVVNHPQDVQTTRRVDVAQRLRAIERVRTPQMQAFPRAALLQSNAAAVLGNAGFEFPLLLRSLGHHTGQNFEFVENAAQIESAVVGIPGGEILAIEYIDTRNELGAYCKYRVLMVDGELYPLHAATSQDWKVHYFSADMSDEFHRAVDRQFIENMESFLGSRAVCALMDIVDELRLDYGGIDFSLDEDGNVVVFEANATMVIVPPSTDPNYAYRTAPVKAVYNAVERLFRSRTKALQICV